MKATIAACVLSAVALSGCGTAQTTSDIVPIGKDTYMVARPGGALTWSGGEVKAQLYRDAGKFCQQQGKSLMPVSSASSDSSMTQYATAELQFRCLKDTDAEYGRPTMQYSPDVTVKVNR